MSYYLKYLKYKKKYLDLYGGAIALDSNPSNPKCRDECFICAENTTPEQRAILTCGCCFHIDCLNMHINMCIGDRSLLGPTGIKCPNVAAGTCASANANITPEELNDFYRINNIDPSQQINTEQLQAMLALNNNPLKQIDPDQPVDPYIAATSKRCPRKNCGMAISHFHGHACHHMTCNNSGCRNEFCYVCGSDRAANEDARGLYCFCACAPLINQFGNLEPTTWSTFCQPITDSKYISLTPVPHDTRCGCVFCPDCKPSVPASPGVPGTPIIPCSTCDGNCAVCLGIVKQGLKELFNKDNESHKHWLALTNLKKSIEISVPKKNKFFRYTNTDKDNIQEIILEDGDFNSFGDGPKKNVQGNEWLVGFTSLQTLELIRNNINTIKTNTFVPIQNTLTRLELIGQALTAYPSEINKLKNLEHLVIISSGIQSLPNECFISNPKLINLNLSGNKINSINPNAFNGSNIEHLNLSHNEISQIDRDAFFGLNIEHLNLSHNKISTLFKLPSSLITLNLSDNKLTIIETSSTLHSSDSPFNSIQSFDPARIQLNIEYFNFSNNEITEIQTKAFSRLLNLKNINLEQNTIISIREKAFFSCVKLKTIKILNKTPKPNEKPKPELKFLTNWYQNTPKLQITINGEDKINRR